MNNILKEKNVGKNLVNSLSPEAIAEIQSGLYDGKPLLGKNGILSSMIKEMVELALQAEMEDHLNDNILENSNRRNGFSNKRVSSPVGDFELSTPRDRNGLFQPEIVKKRQTALTEELDNKILSLYSIGNSYSDIAKHMEELYGTEISDAKISSITDKLLPKIVEWRNRTLEKQYAIVFLDAMFFRARDGNKTTSKAIYNIMGIDMEGNKDILGFYTNDSEGSHFWLSVLNDLKARGVEDILICCIDGLKGFPEAISNAFPKTEVRELLFNPILQIF